MEDMTHKDFLISCSKGYFLNCLQTKLLIDQNFTATLLMRTKTLKMIEKFQDINSKYLKKILNANIEYVAQKNRESLLSYNEEEPIDIVKI